MAYEQRDNSGTLGKNNNRTSPNHPEYSGKIMVAGVMYWLNAWVKEGPNGKFFSLSVKPKEQPRDEGKEMRPAVPGDRRADLDDEIPF